MLGSKGKKSPTTKKDTTGSARWPDRFCCAQFFSIQLPRSDLPPDNQWLPLRFCARTFLEPIRAYVRDLWAPRQASTSSVRVSISERKAAGSGTQNLLRVFLASCIRASIWSNQ